LSSSTDLQKQVLRERMKQLRSKTTAKERIRAGERILRAVTGKDAPIPGLGRGTVLAMYASDDGEPDFLPFLADLLASEVICCFPAFQESEMVFIPIEDESDFIPGAFGIRQPSGRIQPVAGDQIDIMLMPGLAFDFRGGRLGRGKGYYDRYISRIEPKKRPMAIGTAHDFQLLDFVPTDADDISADYVFTPERSFFVRS